MREVIKAPDSYFTGAMGESLTEFMFQKNHIVCTKLSGSDFGEDFLCDIFSASQEYSTTYVRTRFSFRTQVKSTAEFEKGGYIRKTKKGLSISLSTRLLKLWEQSYYPVVLIVWECSKNIGYWCFPIEETDIEKTENNTVTISVKYNHVFDDRGVQRIKKQVEDYYLTKIYKIYKSKYKCNIYLIWMPQYKIFTSMEIYNNIPIQASENMKVISSLLNMLPAFLTSYHHCEFGYIAGIEYTANARPIEQFWDKIYKDIMQIKPNLSKNEWIGFIISPLEIISELDERRISNLTEWTRFSLIKDSIITDFNFTFDLSESYVYSEKVSARSDEQDFYVHDSGDFAVEVFSAGFSVHTRKTDFKLARTIRNKSFCIVDISKCSAKEVKQIAEWCREREYRFVVLKDDKSKIAITHKLFDITNEGTFLPGITTWKEWDQLQFESKEFLEQIPFGNPLKPKEKEKIFNKYFQKEKYSDVCLLRYSQTLRAEALDHSNRIIKFVTYVGIFDEHECKMYFEDAQKKLEDKLKYFGLYYESYDNISNIILEICPEFHQSTQQIVALVEKIYHDLVIKIRKQSSCQENMGYYVKYCLDRWVPEKLVEKK